MVAAREGKVGMLRMLIQYGADVNLTNKVTGFVWWVISYTLLLCICALKDENTGTGIGTESLLY